MSGSTADSVTVNHPDVSANGTCLCGYIEISFAALVDALGDPSTGDEYKIDAHWTLGFPDGAVATIYNYKDGPNYLGDEGTPVDRITEWHIGGHPGVGRPGADELVARVWSLIERRPQVPSLHTPAPPANRPPGVGTLDGRRPGEPCVLHASGPLDNGFPVLFVSAVSRERWTREQLVAVRDDCNRVLGELGETD